MYSKDDVENPMVEGLPFDDNEFRFVKDEVIYDDLFLDELEVLTLAEWMEMLLEMEDEDERPY